MRFLGPGIFFAHHFLKYSSYFKARLKRLLFHNLFPISSSAMLFALCFCDLTYVFDRIMYSVLTSLVFSWYLINSIAGTIRREETRMFYNFYIISSPKTEFNNCLMSKWNEHVGKFWDRWGHVQVSVTSCEFSPCPCSTRPSIKDAPFITHLLHVPGASLWPFDSRLKKKKKPLQRSLFPVFRWGHGSSPRLRNLPQVTSPLGNRIKVKDSPSLLAPRLRLLKPPGVSRRAARLSASPDSVSGFSAPGEWVSLKSILDVVIIL